MKVSFEGVGQVCATFLGDKLTEGQTVKMTGNGTVGACAADDVFCGVAVCCKDDACTVQVGGFVTVGYTGTAPGVGWQALSANGSGGVKTAGGAEAASEGSVKTASDGVNCLVVNVDTTAKTVTILL